MKGKNSNWYIKIFVAFSGWLSSIFFISFFFIIFSEIFFINDYTIAFIGLILIVTTLIIFKKGLTDDSIFMENFILTIALSGDVIFIMGIEHIFDSEYYNMFLVTTVLILGVLAWFIPNYIHRVITTFFGILTLYELYILLVGNRVVYPFLTLLTIFITLLWLYIDKFKDIKKLETIAYGLVFAIISIIANMTFIRVKIDDTNNWLLLLFVASSLILGILLLFIAFQIIKESKIVNLKRDIILILSGIIVSIIADLFIKSIIIGIILLIVGFYRDKRILMAIGVGLITFLLSRYYYFLGDTLLFKSQILLLNSFIFGLGYFLIKKEKEKKLCLKKG